MRLLRIRAVVVVAALTCAIKAAPASPVPLTAPAPARPAQGTPPEAKAEAKAEAKTEAKAKAMLGKVIAHAKAVDRKQAFFEFTARRRPFFERDLYVVCVDAHLLVVAHGGFPTYVGSASFFKDASGTLMAPVIWDAATKGDGAVRYTIRDDESNNTVERKIGFFKRVKDDVCGVVAHLP
jgi:hypothetical protein